MLETLQLIDVIKERRGEFFFDSSIHRKFKTVISYSLFGSIFSFVIFRCRQSVIKELYSLSLSIYGSNKSVSQSVLSHEDIVLFNR